MKLSLKYKLLVVFIVILMIPMVGGTGVALMAFSDKFNERHQKEMEATARIAQGVFEDLEKTAASYINLLAGEDFLRQALASKGREGAATGLAKFYSKARLNGISYLEVTDAQGNIFIRVHDSDTSGASQQANPIIKKALAGEMAGGPLAGPEGLFLLASGPVKGEGGQVLGTVTTGYTLDKAVVEKIKRLTGAEIAVYRQNRVLASTFGQEKAQQGEYLLDGEKIKEVVLEEGKAYSGFSELDGIPVAVTYTPIRGLDGKVLAMLMVAKSRQDILEAQWGTVKKLSVLTVISLVAIVLITLLLSNKALAPLLELVRSTESLAQGELSHQVKVAAGDEIGNLGEAYNKMVASWREIVTRLSTTASQVTSSSEQLAAAADQTSSSSESIASTVVQLAAGADNQAKSVQATAATIEEMASNLSNVASHARSVAAASSEALQVARDGGKVVGVVTGKMEDIRVNVDKSAQTIKQLVKRSKEIEEIIRVITGIAEETNLLALNAAIEAAHAGEQGRGFAVVAGEVRKLAEQSGRSAEEIARLIREMQKETQEAMEAMEEGTREVAGGVMAVGQAGQAFGQIVQVVENIAGQISEVSTAVEQMNAGSSQIVEAINQVAAIAQEVAQGSEQVSTAAEEQMASMEEIASLANLLSKMAEELREIVNRFKL